MEKPIARARVAVQVRDAYVIVKMAQEAPVNQLPAMVTMHMSILTRKSVSIQILIKGADHNVSTELIISKQVYSYWHISICIIRDLGWIRFKHQLCVGICNSSRRGSKVILPTPGILLQGSKYKNKGDSRRDSFWYEKRNKEQFSKSTRW